MGTWSGMHAELMDLARQINAIEFDHVFTLDGSKIGAAITYPPGVHAPSVYHDDETDVRIEGTGWEALTGFTGQQGYHGAVNHSSEYIGTAIAEELSRLSEDAPQTFVVVTVEVDDDDEDDPEPAGWAILQYTGS